MSQTVSPPPLLTDLRALPRTFWVIFAGSFINRFGTFVMPFLTIYLVRQGYSLTAASFAVSAFGLGSFCGSGFGGYLSDKIGRRNTIVLGAGAASVMCMGIYLADSFAMIALFAALNGFAGGVHHPASSALLADVVPPERRVRAYAAMRLAINAGFACGSATAGFLVETPLWLFVGDAVTTAVFGLVALVALPHGLRASSQEAPWSAAITVIRKDRGFHALFVATLCSALIYSQFSSTYSLHVLNTGLSVQLGSIHLTGANLFGLLIGWNGLMVVLGELPLTQWSQRYRPQYAMAAGYLLLGIGFMLNAAPGALAMLFFAMTIFTLGEMISSPVSSAYVAHLAPPAMRGRYMGTLALAWSSASMIGPPVGMQLFSFSPLLLWMTCGLLGLLGAIILLRSPAQDVAPAAPVLEPDQPAISS
ncbi:MAG: MDR family MFS transporter [Chthoniobacteraceae bacterium]